MYCLKYHSDHLLNFELKWIQTSAYAGIEEGDRQKALVGLFHQYSVKFV